MSSMVPRARGGRLVALTLAVLCLVGGAPRGAHAQFGGLLKKAAEKAVDKASGAEDKVSPRVNGAELTDDALERLLKGLGVTAQKLAQRDALQANAESKGKAASELRTPNEAAIQAWESAGSTWHDCFSTQWNKLVRNREGQTKVGAMKMYQTRLLRS